MQHTFLRDSRVTLPPRANSGFALHGTVVDSDATGQRVVVNWDDGLTSEIRGDLLEQQAA